MLSPVMSLSLSPWSAACRSRRPGLGVIAAEIDELRAGALQFGDDRAIVLFSRIDALEHDLGHAAGVQLVLDDGGEALSVGPLVVQNGDFLALVFLGDPWGDERALRVVARIKAHDCRMPLLGQGRVRRSGAHHQDIVLSIDVGRRNRRSRARVAVDIFDLLPDDEVGDRHRLLRIARVVLDHDLDLAPVDPAGLVDRRGGGLGAPLHLFADRRHRPGHRPGDRDGDVLSAGRRRSVPIARGWSSTIAQELAHFGFLP